MDEKNFLENDELKKEENYHFVKEVRKRKSIRPRDILVRFCCIVIGAVLFGIIAAFVFVRFLPVLQKEDEEASAINIEEDDPNESEQDVTKHPVPPVLPIVTATPTPTVTPDQTPTPEQTDPDESGKGTAQEESPVQIYREIYSEMQMIAEKAMYSMVTVTGITNSEDWFNVQTESVKQASGVLVAENEQEFFVLTEYKAVDNVERIVITFADGHIVDGRYQMHDPNTGLTILKVAKSEIAAITKAIISVVKLANSYRVKQGDAVIALGSPMGYSNSVVYGQISSTTNIVSTYDIQYNLFTTNMLGNSAGSGVLINLDGEVISVIAQSFGIEEHENIITGLPISQLKRLMETLSNGEKFAVIGIMGQNVTQEVMDQTGMPKGVYVSSLKNESPAFQAGIRNGDIIIKYEGETVENMAQYTEKLRDTIPGSIVDLTIMRMSTEGYREFDFRIVTETW